MRAPKLILAALTGVLAPIVFASAPAAASGVFTNPTPIAIDGGAAAPSSINVQGQTGRITNVEVTLRKLSHEYASDLDILVVAPDGQTSILTSDACGGSIPGYSWIFTESAAEWIGAGFKPCDGLFYRPNDVASSDGADVWPGAPAGPHRPNLDRFMGGNPNGTWSLLVVDDHPASYSGKIELGWALQVETAGADTLVPANGGSGVADPYPATRNVSGMSGVIEDIEVSLSGIYHQRPDDLDMLLVGPRGQAVMLMSDVCGFLPAKNYSWAWDDEAAGAMPLSTCPNGGRFRPTDGGQVGELLLAPAPAGFRASSLAAFDSTDPNGDWRLFVVDDQGRDAPAGYFDDARGFFAERFTLSIETRPSAAVSFAQGAVDIGEGQTRELTLTRTDDGNGLGPGTVTVTSSALTATSGEDYKPVSTTVAFAPDQTQQVITIEAPADSLGEQPETFELTIGQGTGDAAPATAPTATVTIHDPDAGGSGGGPGGGPLVIDRDAPLVSGVALRPATFAVGRRGTARAARRGTTIRYTLSEPAAVTLRFRRATARRYIAAGTLRRAGRSGPNRVAFSGRVGRRALRPGAYRLVVSAVDAAGNRSTSPPKRFRILK